ncbi:response regulator transcription factor [soil metagenome]
MVDFMDINSFYGRSAHQVYEPNPNRIGHVGFFCLEELALPAPAISYSRRDYFKISLVSGRSTIQYAQTTIQVEESALVFTNPLIPYRWQPQDEPQTGFVCLFTESFFQQFLPIKAYPVFQHPDQSVIPLTEEKRRQFTELFLSIQRELASEYAFKDDSVRSQILNLIHQAQKGQPARGTVALDHIASERMTLLFADLLERQFPIESTAQRFPLRSATAIAGHLQTHSNHLNRVLKETTGKTTSQSITNRLMDEACRLLRETHWTIAEISWSLGFDEPHHFSAFFKKHRQQTPSQFRLEAIA